MRRPNSLDEAKICTSIAQPIMHRAIMAAMLEYIDTVKVHGFGSYSISYCFSTLAAEAGSVAGKYAKDFRMPNDISPLLAELLISCYQREHTNAKGVALSPNDGGTDSECKCGHTVWIQTLDAVTCGACGEVKP